MKLEFNIEWQTYTMYLHYIKHVACVWRIWNCDYSIVTSI